MPQFWYIVEALVALARHRRNGRKPFTRNDLRAWSDKIKARPKSAQVALDHLEASGLIRRTPGVPDATQGQWTYSLTREGLAAAIAAEEARYRDEKAQNKLADPSSYSARVYALLRMRKTLTAPEAAATLIDAGGDVKTATQQASRYLRTWSQIYPSAVKVSARRENGALRYVLLEEIGSLAPPAAANNEAARGGATA